RAYPAKVSEVPPTFDAASHALKVRLEVTNSGLTLRPDMFVDVEFAVTLPSAVTVPSDAVLDSGLRKTMFIDRGGGSFEPRPVETGGGWGDRVATTQGVKAGERVVAAGAFLVDSESRMGTAATGRPPATAVAPP